jgi:hypothetical protein
VTCWDLSNSCETHNPQESLLRNSQLISKKACLATSRSEAIGGEEAIPLDLRSSDEDGDVLAARCIILMLMLVVVVSKHMRKKPSSLNYPNTPF